MDIDVQKLAELKKQFEKIVGHEIDLSEEQLLAGSFPFASSTYFARHDDDNDAWVANWRIVPPTSCNDSELLDTSGRSTTGPDGKIVFRLSDFLCGRFGYFLEPVNLVATPQGTEPFYVTMNHELIKGPPHYPFTMMCRSRLFLGTTMEGPHPTLVSIGGAEWLRRRCFRTRV